MKSAFVAGTGLIGASIGLGLREAGWQVTGWDPSPAAIEGALAVGAVSKVASNLAEAAATGHDLVVLAGPPGAVISSVQVLDVATLTIDVAGVKEPVVQAAAGMPRFVGTHPMAGREMSGPSGASRGLFTGATWVLATDGATEEDLRYVETVVHELGANPVRMTAADHDVAIATVSHLPQILAGALVTAAEDADVRALASGSFRDLTRVAASDPDLWAGLLRSNRVAVESAAHSLIQRLEGLLGALDEPDALVAKLDRARTLRSQLAPPVIAVRVALTDRPGELAKVGRALGSSSVDVRDLQLRHAVHGGGGVLTLSVRPGEAGLLTSALVAEGLLLVD